MGERKKRIGQILREMELVTEPQIQEALTLQRNQDGVLGEILVRLGYVAPEEVLLALAAQVGMEWVDLTQVPPDVADRTFRWMKGDDVRFDVREGIPVTDSGPAVKLVDLILTTALDAGATEIRLELLPDRFQIRHRVDGVLYEMESPPRHLAPLILERVRRLTGLAAAAPDERVERHVRAVFAGRRFRVDAAWIRAAEQESVVLRFVEG